MLLQFNFTNFKSFRNDTTLDLTATGISEFSNHIVKFGNEKVLPLAGIFGANASGKSNVYQAFEYMTFYVLRSFEYGGDTDNSKSTFTRPAPYLFSNKTKDAESSFEVYFIDADERTYNYGFSVDSQGVNEEWLNSRAKTARGDFTPIFYRGRNNKKLDLSGITKKSIENIKIALEKEVLIVSLGAKLKIEKLKKIRDWFLKCYIANYGVPFVNLQLSMIIPHNFATDKKVQDDVIKYFSKFDPSIVKFNIKNSDLENEDDKQHIRVDALHKMNDCDDYASIPLKDESSGTLKMFSLYPMLKKVLDNGSVLFVDELNSRLHPLLMRAFITTFLDPEININHAQLLFTSHDSWQMNKEFLRRDEIWFTEKDSEGTSSLYSLSDFTDTDGSKIRKDENYEKNYLRGKYGAIPRVQSLFSEEGFNE